MWKRLQIQSFLHSRHNKNHQTCFCVIKPIKRSSIILFVHKNVSAGTNVDTVLLLTHALLQSNHWSYTSATPHLFYQRSIFFFTPTQKCTYTVYQEHVNVPTHTHSLTWASCLMCAPDGEWNCSFVREKEKDGGSGCLLHAMFSLWN